MRINLYEPYVSERLIKFRKTVMIIYKTERWDKSVQRKN